MLNRKLIAPSPRNPEVRSTLRELQEEAILLTLPGLYVVGTCLVLFSGVFRTSLEGAVPGMLLLGLAPLVWTARKVNYALSTGTLISGILAVICVLIFWANIPSAVGLLAIPVGLLTLFVGVTAGVAGAAALSFAIALLPYDVVLADTSQMYLAILQVWATLWLVWMTLRSLLTATVWFRNTYEQSRELLEEARDHQLRLSETLEDLAEANVQLSRLHRLANSMRQLAEEARRTKDQFVANVSHELRTPLNMIIGFTDMIMQAPQTYGPNVPQALLADLEIVRRNSQHLSNLIDDVLDLSQIDTDHMALDKEKVALADVVEVAVAAVQPLYESKKLALVADIPSDLPLLNCDPIRIRQVLLNLLSNAGRFTEFGEVRITAVREPGSITVSVADSGPGITDSDMHRLFEPFQQLDGSIRRRYGGSGLGLSISKGFVELHGGKMWVESVRGVGTTFHFRLPIDTPISTGDSALRWLMPHAPYQERNRRANAPRQPVLPRIVVLETGRSLQRMVARYLDNSQVIPVSTWEAAMAELADQPCQALLVNDMLVPTRLKRLESVELPYGTPVIVCSVPGAVESADRLGVSDYLVKPVARDDLLQVLDPLCETGSTLLVVDDDNEAQRLFRRMLASANREYRVIRASNGEQAMRALLRERPDAVLLDLIMPGVDGFQFIAAKNQDEALRDIPVVVLSAQDPAGQPIVCKSVAATRGGGISVRRLLASIEALTHVLAPQRADLHSESIEEGASADGFADEASRAKAGSQLLLREDGGYDDGDIAQHRMGVQSPQ